MQNNTQKVSLKWFSQVKDELNKAKDLINIKEFSGAYFHFRKVAMKASKAYLFQNLKSRKILLTHSFNDLLKMVIVFDRFTRLH